MMRRWMGKHWGKSLSVCWKADPYFDCYYTYITKEKGYVEFLYYIYPDYDGMKQQKAKALTFRCIVGTADGKVKGTERINTYEDMGNCQLLDILMEDLNAGNLEGGRTCGFVVDKESALIKDIASEIRENTAGGWQLMRLRYLSGEMCFPMWIPKRRPRTT